jgi:cysteinyl-tRNA synthetase
LTRLEFFEDKEQLAHKGDNEIGGQLETLFDEIVATMDDDLNTPKAVGLLFDVIRLGNQCIDEGKVDLHSAKKFLHVMDLFDHVLGIIPHKHLKLSEEVAQLVKERQESKDAKDYTRADELRKQIEALGYQIDDTLYGPLVKKIK